MTRVVIIDPIFRGSRLFYTRMAADLGDEVTIIARSDARTAESEEAFAGKPIDLREMVTTTKDSWYFHLNPAQMAELEAGLSDVLQGPRPDLLFMSGLDELHNGIAEILGRLAPKLQGTSVFGVHYTPQLTSTRSRIGPIPIPQFLRRFLPSGRFSKMVREFKPLKQAIPGLRIGLLDERVADKVSPRGLFTLLPDPPPPAPEADAGLLSTARAQGGDPTLLLVGRQSRRKGFEDIRGLIESHPESLPSGARIVLCGRLEEDTEPHRGFIEAAAPQLIHIDAYVSDAEIRARYETADYVLLPYTRDFVGSSGVLASASSTGAPVIVTDHGLIAHRVEEHGLGYTYPSGDIAALAAIVSRLPARNSQEYGQMRQRCLDFAERNSIREFRERLRRTIGNAND